MKRRPTTVVGATAASPNTFLPVAISLDMVLLVLAVRVVGDMERKEIVRVGDSYLEWEEQRERCYPV